MSALKIRGRVKEGHRIASGQSPTGHQGLNNTIALQRPFFEADVPGFSLVWDGTINLDISPRTFRILKPDHIVTCEWHPGVVETFWLVKIRALASQGRYSGFIYYPCPSAVKSHKDDMVEILAPKIVGLSYGDKVVVEVSRLKLALI